MIASARPFYRLKPIISKLGLVTSDQYTIAFNGGIIMNNTEDEVVFSGGFTDKQVKEIVRIGKEYGTNMFLYSTNAIYANYNDEKYRKKNPDANYYVEDLDTLDYNAISIFKIAYVNTPEETIKLRQRLPKDLFDAYEISGSVPQFVEIVNKGITKAGALKYIEERLGITRENILAFGDQDNDIPMLQYAGGSVVMGNAPEEMKATATFVTKTNDEDGVAVAINHFWN